MGKKVALALPDDGGDDPPRLVFYKEDIELITKTLGAFLKNAKARCILLVDKAGHLITREGESSSYDVDTLSALVAGSFTAVKRMAKLLGEENCSIMFHPDRKDYIQLTLVGERTILAVVFDDETTQGMVRLYAHQVAKKLTELFHRMIRRRRKGPDSFGGKGPTPLPA